MSGSDTYTEGTLERWERERGEARDEAYRLRQELAETEARLPAEPSAFGPGSEWAVSLERAKDTGDEGQVRQLWRERGRLERQAEEGRWAAERAEADRATADAHGWDAYRAETERLAGSDDPAEQEQAPSRLSFGQFVAVEKAKLATAETHAAAVEIMDAEAEAKGFLPGGAGHPDGDRWVQAFRRELQWLDRGVDDPERRAELEDALEARVEELHEDPRRLNTTPPGSPVVPGSEAGGQTLDAQIADAEAEGRQTGDWSRFDRLQIEATTRR